MADEAATITEQAKHTDEQLVRGIGIPSLTANIVSSTIGAGIFVIPATVAQGLGSAAPLAFVCCAIAMILFVTCFAIAGSRVSLTGGLYAYVEVAFGKYIGFLAGVLYFLTALGAVAGANATSGAPRVTLTTTRAGSWVWGVGDDWDGAVDRTVGAGQALVDQWFSPSGDTYWVQRRDALTPGAGTIVTLDDVAPTSDRWNLAAIEIRAAQ